MSFANAEALNAHLRDRSYVEGYAPSQADYAAFAKLSAAEASKFPYVSRWYNHIAFVLGSLATRYDKQSAKAVNLAEVKTAAPAAAAPAAAAPAAAAAKPAANDDDDFNLDDDDDENQAIIEIAKKKREEDAKKGKAPVIAKSTVILDVKPVGLETDLAALEQKIRAIELEGLTWGSAELKPVAFGVKLIRIVAVIVDALVSVDDLQDRIQGFEDDVQSTDIFAFNKV